MKLWFLSPPQVNQGGAIVGRFFSTNLLSIWPAGHFQPFFFTALRSGCVRIPLKLDQNHPPPHAEDFSSPEFSSADGPLQKLCFFIASLPFFVGKMLFCAYGLICLTVPPYASYSVAKRGGIIRLALPRFLAHNNHLPYFLDFMAIECQVFQSRLRARLYWTLTGMSIALLTALKDGHFIQGTI